MHIVFQVVNVTTTYLAEAEQPWVHERIMVDGQSVGVLTVRLDVGRVLGEIIRAGLPHVGDHTVTIETVP